jgi:hypothetical protein
MDENNQHLRRLLEQTDIAFKALMQEPNSSDLNAAYDNAKAELDRYIVSLRNSLAQRHQNLTNRER